MNDAPKSFGTTEDAKEFVKVRKFRDELDAVFEDRVEIYLSLDEELGD